MNPLDTDEGRTIRKILNSKDITEKEEKILTDFVIKSKHITIDYRRKIKNQENLEKIASKSRNNVTRIWAIRQIENQNILEKIAIDSSASNVRIAAIDKIKNVDVLKKVFSQISNPYKVRQTALTHINDKIFIEQAYQKESSARIKNCLLERIIQGKNKDVLKKIALFDSNINARISVITQIDDIDLLLQIYYEIDRRLENERVLEKLQNIIIAKASHDSLITIAFSSRIDEEMRIKAIKTIKDQKILKELSSDKNIESIRKVAIEQIEDKKFLEQLYYKEHNLIIKEILCRILINNADIKLLKKIATDKDLDFINASLRMKATRILIGTADISLLKNIILEKNLYAIDDSMYSKIVKKIMIIINVADTKLLKEIIIEEDWDTIDISLRLEAIKRMNDINFLMQRWYSESDNELKNMIGKKIVDNIFPVLQFFKKEKNNSQKRKIADVFDTNSEIDSISNINELRRLAILKNPAKRVVGLIYETDSIPLLKYLAKFGSCKPSIHLEEWTMLIVQLSKKDLEIAKKIEFDKPRYQFVDFYNDKYDEDSLLEIALETNNSDILWNCVSKIKNQNFLEIIFYSSRSSFIRSCIVDKISSQGILKRMIFSMMDGYLCEKIIKKINDKIILMEIKNKHKDYRIKHCAEEKLKQM